MLKVAIALIKEFLLLGRGNVFDKFEICLKKKEKIVNFKLVEIK